MRIIIYGAGAIGSVIGGYLHNKGLETILVCSKAHAEAISRGGLKITGIHGDFDLEDRLTNHMVKRWRCGAEFDLVSAAWCGCGKHVVTPSKSCPYCSQCMCFHPDYGNDECWGEPPRFLKEHGFDRLFYMYL